MKILAVIVAIVLLLIPITIGILIWIYLKEDIKVMVSFYKDMMKELPSFRKSKINVKELLSELKKNKDLLKK